MKDLCQITVYILLGIQLAGAVTSVNAQTIRPGSSRNRIRMAQDYERRGHYDAALKIYKELYDVVPKNQVYYEGVKRNMLRLKRFDQLKQIVQAQIRLTDGVKYHADLGQVLYQDGDREGAMRLWQGLLSRFADQKAAYTYVANAMISNRLYDEAIDVYLNGRHHFDSDGVFVFELANLYVIRLKLKEATQEYLKQLAKNPNQFSYVESRLVNYTKDPDQARQVVAVLQEYLSKHKESFLGRKLLANLYLRMQDFDGALRQFKLLEGQKAIRQKQKDVSGQHLYFFAEKALNAKKFAYAEDAYELILENYPKSPYRPRALFGLALAKQQRGKPTEALQRFQQVLQIDDKSSWAREALFHIGDIYFKDLFEIDKALDTYNLLLNRYPREKKTPETLFRIGDCYAAKGDLGNAEYAYKRAVAAAVPKSPYIDQGRFKMAYLQFLQAEYDSALTSLNKITQELDSPNVDQSFVNDAFELSFLIEENQADSSGALAAYAEARKLRMQHRDQEAIAALKHIILAFPQAEIVDETLVELGNIEAERGEYLAAIDYFKTLLTEHGESVYNAQAQKRIAEIYETGLGDNDKAFAAYENVLINYPGSLYVEEVRRKLRELQTTRLNN